MTGAAERMRRALGRTGLYTDPEDQILAGELAAYGTALDAFYAAAEEVRKNLFVQTADAETLGRFERLFRTVPSSAGEDVRRAMLLQRGNVAPGDCSKEALERQLFGAGIRGEIVEQADGLYVNVLEVLGISEEAALRDAELMLPADLPANVDFGRNFWDTVDARGDPFDRMDAAGLTWDEIDRL